MMRKLLHRLNTTHLDLEAIKQIEQAQYPIIMAPFFGTPVPVMVRELTQAQIIACGSFSLIETFKDKIEKQQKSDNIDLETILEYSEKHHEICKRSLIKPTYEEIIETLTDSVILKSKEKLEQLREKIKDIPRSEEREKIEQEINSLQVWTDLILPDDFTAFIVSYVLGVDKSDIKELSKETLLQAAVLAEFGHDNPANHIDGKFTAFMRDDINSRAWMLLNEQRKEKQVRNGA